jgi:hypothetical protein
MMDSLSSLPLDIWRATLEFLTIPDQISFAWTSKEIFSMMEQTGVMEAYAKSKFPLPLLDLAQYNHSWLQLVQHDNAKNGYYRLQLHHRPLHFGLTHGLLFRTLSVHNVRSMSWDRLHNEIILEIEVFGDDLPTRIAALTECMLVVREVEDHLPTTTPTTSSSCLPDDQETGCCPPPLFQKVAPLRFEEYEHNTNQHQLFRLYLDATLILSDTTYSYKYSYNNESAVSFLSRDHFSSIRELFDAPKQNNHKQQRGVGGGEELSIARQVSIDEGVGREDDAGINMALLNLEAMQYYVQQSPQQEPGPCEFVSRSTPALEPSNVLDWDIIRTRLPESIREQRHHGSISR